jgi:hypothetical protein
MRFRSHYLVVTECSVRPEAVAAAKNKLRTAAAASRPKSQWMKNFHLTRPDKTALSALPTPSGMHHRAHRHLPSRCGACADERRVVPAMKGQAFAPFVP